MKRTRRPEEEILHFIPQPAPPACELCQCFPVTLKTKALTRSLDREIAELEPSPRREELERRRQHLRCADTITLYLHGRKELITFPMLKASIPGVTPTNWNLVRDYIFYGPPTNPTPGLGYWFHSIANGLCSRQTMHLIVQPAVADLRLEYAQAVSQGQLAKAVWIRLQATWSIVKMSALWLYGKRPSLF